MGKDTIIILPNGVRCRLTPKSIKFIDELKNFFAERGIPERDIPLYLMELAKREHTRRG